MTPRPPIDELLALFMSTVAREGITTGAGDATGDSIIDAGLIGIGADSFVSMLLIVYPGDFNNVESFDITAFNNVTGEITLSHAYKEVVAAIPVGVPYKIVTFRFVPAEVAALQADIDHVPKFTGEQWFVSKLGNDGNTGTKPDDAFLTILFAVSAAAVGDRIKVMAGIYDEADLDLNLDGLELICEQGTIINHTVTPGTVLVVSADYCRVVGAIVTQAGQIGIDITGDFCSIENCLAFGCATGFDDDGLETHMTDCRSIQHTTTGFAMAGSYGEHDNLIAISEGAVRGIHLDVDTADYNHFKNCHTLGNTTAGWEVIVGANNNVFSHCSTGGGDGAKVDAGADNTWASFGEGSQIVAGQTRDQDLKDIFDLVVATLMGKVQIAATTIDLNQGVGTYDLFTGTTEVVILEALNIKMPTEAAGGAITKISIQTDDVTAGVIINNVDGDVANLTSEADLGWTGTLYITVATKIRLTIEGGAHGSAYVCNVTAKCRAVVSGGYLA